MKERDLNIQDVLRLEPEGRRRRGQRIMEEEEEEEEVYPWIMEEGAEAAEELGVDHLSRSLPLKVGVVQSVVLVQPEECNND